MAEEIVKARVWTKIDTLEAWDANPIILGQGEFAPVLTAVGGSVFNFKVGTGDRRFSDLPWSLQNPGAAIAADTNTVFPPGVPGLYIPTEDGDYDGVTVDLSVGYVQLIWDGTTLVKVEFPIDLSGYVAKADIGYKSGGKNIADPSLANLGVINVSGVYTDIGNPNRKCLIGIPAVPGKKYTISGMADRAGNYVCFWDESNVLVGTVTLANPLPYTVTAPLGATQMCLNVRIDELNDSSWATLQIEEGEVATSYEPFIPYVASIEGSPIVAKSLDEDNRVPDPINEENAVNKRSLSTLTVTPGQGFTDALSAEIERPSEIIITNFGVDEDGTSGGDNAGNLGIIKGNVPDSICDVEGTILDFHVQIQTAGTFYLTIGTPGATFTVRKTLPMFTAVATGWQSFPVNEPIMPGEVIGVGGANGGTAQIAFRSSGHPPTTFAQFKTNLPTAYGPEGSFYAMYYTVQHEEVKPLDADYIRKDSLNDELAEYIATEQLSPDLVTVGSGTSGGTNITSTGDRIYAIGTPAPYNVKISEIRINCGVGSLTFSVGLIDQFGYWIEERAFTKTAVAGLNTFTVDERMSEGQQLALKTPSATLETQSGGSYWRSVSDGYGELLEEISGTSLAFEYDIQQLYDHAVVGREEFDVVKSDIVLLQQEKPVVIRSFPSGLKFKLVCDDDGTNLRTESVYPSNVLVLGNSITWHPVTSFWWGTWGMAASEREKDFVHVLESLLQAVNPGATVTPLNIAAFEVNHDTYDFSQLDAHLAGKDETIIRLGENVSNLAGWQDSLENLVDHIRSVVPSMRVAITGVFWANSAKDSAQEGAASAKGIPFVPLSDLDTPANRSYVGAQVYGDDSQWHTVNNSGVGAHPGDTGMLAIGERIHYTLH